MENERPDRKDLLIEIEAEPEKGVDMLLSLLERCDTLSECVRSLEQNLQKAEEKIKSLESNSRNSSKPPSSDFGQNTPKPKSQRKKSGKKPGGQPGHKGSTLKQVAEPDHVVTHLVEPGTQCEKCGALLPVGSEQGLNERHSCEPLVRQVYELPAIRIEVTEHRAQRIVCPICDTITTANFPEGVDAHTQYGPNVKAAAIYLSTYQMIPYQRLGELFDTLFGCPLSQGTLANFIKTGGKRAAIAASEIKELIKASKHMHSDETGCRVHGQRHWLHTASTDDLTYYMIHQKRGYEAMVDMGILPDYTGRVVHDYLQAYYRFTLCEHSQCNAHILRELVYILEQMDQSWAQEMIDLLLRAKDLRAKENARGPTDRKVIGEVTRQKIQSEYCTIVEKGFAINPEPEKEPGKRGRPKRGKALNLLHRFEDRYEEIMGFFEYEGVPFDNNLAERDLRMMKTREKISGTFRSIEHPEAFTNIRSVISSLRKRGNSILDGIAQMLTSPSGMFTKSS